MNIIQVNRSTWDSEFKRTLDSLDLDRLRKGTIDPKLNTAAEVRNFISDIHRKFHYELCMLKSRLEKS